MVLSTAKERDFHRSPVTEEEFAAWAAMTPEQRALFGGMLTASFQWLLDREGDNVQAWLDRAVKLNGVRPDPGQAA